MDRKRRTLTLAKSDPPNRPTRKAFPFKSRKPDFAAKVNRHIDELAPNDGLRHVLLKLRNQFAMEKARIESGGYSLSNARTEHLLSELIEKQRVDLLREKAQLEEQAKRLTLVIEGFECFSKPFLIQNVQDLKWLQEQMEDPKNPRSLRRALRIYDYLREHHEDDIDRNALTARAPELLMSFRIGKDGLFEQPPILVVPDKSAGLLGLREGIRRQAFAMHIRKMEKAGWIRKTRYKAGSRGGHYYLMGYVQPFYDKPEEGKKGTAIQVKRFLLTRDVYNATKWFWDGEEDQKVNT